MNDKIEKYFQFKIFFSNKITKIKKKTKTKFERIN